MTTRRVTGASVERLEQRLSERDWQIIQSLSSCRVLTGQQLTRLHFFDLSPVTQDRVRRRVLQRLHHLHIVEPLDRLVGGVRAGSSGLIFCLGVAGQRLLQLQAAQRDGQRVRTPWTPSALFLKHALAVAEVYVQLVEAERASSFKVHSFVTEPTSWWPDGLGGHLKPDALVVLSTTDYDEVIWLEVDRGTESLPTLKRKLETYERWAARGQLGPSSVLPHVVISVNSEQRLQAVQSLVEASTDRAIFSAVLQPNIAKHLLAFLADTQVPP